MLMVVLPLQAIGQPQRLSFLRDAETEALIREIGGPVFQAAGLNPAAVDIYLIDSPTLNAFVTGGQNIFFNTGMFTHTESVSELLGVLAHEAGHIAGGHLARGQDAIENARRTALLTTLLGVAAAIAAQDGGLGAAVVAVLDAVLMVAGQSLQVFYQIPFAMVQLIQAIVVICVAASDFFVRHRLRWTA